ncbi:MAG: beta-propeller domain-containing protein, partial [Verrucomicrobiales bacterium]|nr:beta-propeller domain-containing protein [Verrucomicrobiales bacterium]
MKRPRPFLAPAAACLLSLLAMLIAPASAQTLRPPEIESIAVDALGARVSISVPVGTRRIVLESTRREDLQGWTPRAVRRLDGTAQTVVIDLAADAHHELLRVRAEDSDPLAAFAQGRTNIAPTPLPAGTTPLLRNGEVVYDSAGQPPSTIPNANANAGGGGGQRTVTESDIWKVRGSRLYFFNQLRGLQSVDVTTPDAPRLLGTLSFPAAGEQLYAPDDQHVVLLLREDCRGNGFNGAAVVIVNVAEPQPREIARLPVPGRLFESRMVGTALYVASQTYEEATPRNGVWEMATVVSSFDLANPAAPVTRDSRRIPGSASVVTANASFFFVGLDVYQDARPRTTVLHALDISSPDGAVAAFATLELDGWIRDKFKLDVQDDVLRVVLETQEKSDRWSPITRLSTWRLQRDGAGPTKPLGQLDLGAGENLFGTRFDGNRAYIVTFRRVDPLWIVDLTDPTQPKILGELEIPGWSNYLHPLGDRLLTVGIDNTTNWRAAVQLFDVSNPAKPALLAKIPLGEQWSSSEANSDEKALGVFPADGLVLIPFSGASTNGYVQGVQIIDLGQDTLKARGVISHPELTPRRSTVLGARVLSLSARELLTVDIADRDQPKVTASLDLSRRADRVVTARQHLLTFSGTDLQVASLAAPDDVLSTTSLGKLPVLGAVARGDLMYVLQGVPASVTWNQAPTGDQWITVTNAGLLQLRVFSLAQLPALAETGTVSIDHEFTSGGVFDPLWPSETTLVWASRDTGGFFRYWLDVPMNIDLAPGGGVSFAAPDVASRDLAAVAAPVVDGRFAFWPGRWWGQPQALFAFDVTQPAAPVYRGATLSASGAVRASKAYAGTGTVLFSEEFQESSIVGSNKVTWLESIYTLVTNTVLKTNVIATPIQEWVTNTTKVT